jgi:thiazole synthase ThiGH ThiG subunit
LELPDLLIDEDQTSQFIRYCEALAAGTLDARDRSIKEAKANTRYSRHLGTIEMIRDTIVRYQKLLSPDEVKALRAKRPLTPAFCGRFCDDVLNASASHF